MQINSILSRYPKTRTVLPAAFRRIYNQHYLNNRHGVYKTTFWSKRIEAWMHKKVASDLIKNQYIAASTSTLEIGAGTLNQISYEPRSRTYDIVEPFRQLYQNLPELSHVRHIYKDISDIHSPRYDRITSIATFEHITDLPTVVAKSALLLKSKTSCLRVAIPNEGTILWKLGTLITGLEFYIGYGLDYQTFMRHEHVNTADEIESVLRCFFDQVECEVLGLNKNLALYRVYICTYPKRKFATRYIFR